MKWWSTSVAYGLSDEPDVLRASAYYLTAHELPLRRWAYWQVREWLAWNLHGLIERMPSALHGWWADRMEIPATMALEVRSTRASVEISAEQYGRLTS